MRKPISKKTRFDVFKRDGFTCQYCSAKPPKIPLEVDHIIPVVKGGDNSITNLITSCFDCNRGKGARELHLVPSTTVDKIERMKIAQEQYKEYKKILDKEKKIINAQIDEVDDIYTTFFPQWQLSAKFRIQVRKFIEQIGHESVMDAMEKSCVKIHDSSKAIKYFCGICWNRIRGNE